MKKHHGTWKCWPPKSPGGNGAYVDDIGMVQIQLAHGAPKQVEETFLKPQRRSDNQLSWFFWPLKLKNGSHSPYDTAAISQYIYIHTIEYILCIFDIVR